jgi:hypothetical protein
LPSTALLSRRTTSASPRLAIESYGFIGSGARSVIDALATRIARREDEPLSLIKHFLFYSFGTLVRKTVAQRVLARLPTGGPEAILRLH